MMAEESAFSVGDRVHIVGFFQPLKTATVKRITQVPTFDGDKRIRIFVKNSRGEEYGFWPHELEKVQGKAQAGGE